MKQKKIPLMPILLGGVVFAIITIFFSPMIWLATILAPLPPLVMFLLFQPVAHLNLVERQTEENHLK